ARLTRGITEALPVLINQLQTLNTTTTPTTINPKTNTFKQFTTAKPTHYAILANATTRLLHHAFNAQIAILMDIPSTHAMNFHESNPTL
ncbi:hypothetical protein NL520_27600, partial [Klebsiella pneumoniae]|nr:hypothetical protein [Klebsiella pneumoniae]